ncbi:hypothetical protein BJ508DRAFT_306006 [Ascobolus immersus RN42]|uniref:Polyprenal reductase n=1 Tax=Ascobolus immersus RN42 TaxID=1160509 RepID=A0A3N4ID90_ASCIM|nr:hypothetical protein BJ508DRAFT_306006 [Ascobolus immersus RN42]
MHRQIPLSCPSCTPPLLIADLLPPLTQSTLYTLSALALATQFTPFLRKRLLGYGKTIQTVDWKDNTKDGKPAKKRLLSWVFETTVPHSYFLHFYVLALSLMTASIVGILLPAHISPLKLLLSLEVPTAIAKDPWFINYVLHPLRIQAGYSSAGNGAVNWWVLLAVTAQVGRRLWEDSTLPGKAWDKSSRERMALGGEVTIPKAGGAGQEGKETEKEHGKTEGSRMPLPIYISGMLFYVLLCISSWADASRTILSYEAPLPSRSQLLHITSSPLSLPDVHILLSLPVFLLASGTQHDIHMYLSTLEKYTLPPAKSWFSWVMAPHYTMECVVYAALVGMGYGEGRCVVAAAVFVWTNLTLLGMRQRAWYGEKFGERMGNRGGTWPWL